MSNGLHDGHYFYISYTKLMDTISLKEWSSKCD